MRNNLHYREKFRRYRRHLLLTKDIERKAPAFGSTDGTPMADRTVIAKYFSPYSDWRWYAVEGERTDDGDFMFFGLVVGHEAEWGYFLLSELEGTTLGTFRLPAVERDLYTKGNLAKMIDSDYAPGVDPRFAALHAEFAGALAEAS